MSVEQRTLADHVLMVFIAVELSFISVIGNGSFLSIFARFKNLRNFPNILFASLAVIDFLNALINVPLLVLYFVVQPSWLEGKTWAIISSSLHLEFILLSIVSMFALMMDRCLAVYLDLKYFTWKTTKKAYFAVFFMWLGCTTVAALASVPVFDLDLDDLPLQKSQRIISLQRKWFTSPFMAVFVTAATVLGIVTSYTIYQKKNQRLLLYLPPLQAEARFKQDIKATKTVALAVVTYFVCYVPAIAAAVWHRDADNTLHSWFNFLSSFCTLASSASNPIIYVMRNRRFRAALRQIVKDPCGRTPFQERPVRNGKGGQEQRHNNPRREAEQLEGEKPGASTRPEENPESEARSAIATTATSQMLRCNRMVKIAWQADEDSSRSSSLDNEQVTVCNG